MDLFKIVYLSLICVSILLSGYGAIYYTIDLCLRHKSKKIEKVKEPKLKKVKEIVTISYRIIFYDASGKVINNLIVKNKHDIKNALKTARKTAPNQVAKYKVEQLENKSLK